MNNLPLNDRLTSLTCVSRFSRRSLQPMLKAMHAFVSLHSATAPSTVVHQQVFDELSLELAGTSMDEEALQCSPVPILLPSSTRYGKSREKHEKGTLDGLPGHFDSTQACPRPARLGPTAASISVPTLVDDDFVCHPERLAAARNKWQPVALGYLELIGLCEVHPWANVSVISLSSPVADTRPEHRETVSFIARTRLGHLQNQTRGSQLEHLKPPISSLYLSLDAR